MKYIKLLFLFIMVIVLCGCYGEFQPKYESMGAVVTIDNHTSNTCDVYGWLENTSNIPLRLKMIKLKDNKEIAYTKWITVFIPGEKRHIFLDDKCALHIYKEDGTEIGYLMMVRE